jgi:hypothetical protein
VFLLVSITFLQHYQNEKKFQVRSPFKWDVALRHGVKSARRYEITYWSQMDISTIEEDINLVSPNVDHQSPSDAVTCPKGISNTGLRKPKNSQEISNIS